MVLGNDQQNGLIFSHAVQKKTRRKPQITKIKNEKGNITTILTEINWLAHLHSQGGEYERI